MSMQDYVQCLAVSHDGQWVVSGSTDGQVRFRDAKTWIVQLVLQGHGKKRTGLLFPSTPTTNHSEADVSTAPVYSVDHNPCGGILATAATDGKIRICKFPPRYSQLRLTGVHSREVLCYFLTSVESLCLNYFPPSLFFFNIFAPDQSICLPFGSRLLLVKGKVCTPG